MWKERFEISKLKQLPPTWTVCLSSFRKYLQSSAQRIHNPWFKPLYFACHVPRSNHFLQLVVLWLNLHLVGLGMFWLEGATVDATEFYRSLPRRTCLEFGRVKICLWKSFLSLFSRVSRSWSPKMTAGPKIEPRIGTGNLRCVRKSNLRSRTYRS